MKKALSLILALVICLSLCACVTEETVDIKSVPTLNIDIAGGEIRSNIARNKDTYHGNFYKIEGDVWDISSSYIEIVSGFYNWHLKVYFKNKEDIVSLNKGDTITVVGKFEVRNKYNFRVTQAVLIEIE